MPAFSLIFNKLQVTNPTKKLSLSVDSSVSLQCSSENPQPMKNRQLLDLLCSGKVWVIHGNGCRVDFVFLLDGKQYEEPGIKKIIAGFAAFVRDLPVLLNAELELPESGINGHVQSKFSIILRNAPFRGISGHSSVPLLSTPPDVQVPTGVPCFQLRRIKIVMTFSSERPYHHPRSSLPSMAADGATDRFAQHTSGLYPDALSCQDHEMLDNDALFYRLDIAIPLLTAQSLTKKLSMLPSPPKSQEEEMEDTRADCGMTSITSDFHCAREMANLALRKLVGGRQNKSLPGIKLALRRPTLTLSKLVPSLFSPGFAEAMSQRSKFIPTISHALSISLLRNAQSPCLRRKLLSLASNPVQPRDNDDFMDPVDGIGDHSSPLGRSTSRTLSQVVEERLWAMMQGSLSHQSSARNVLPPENVDTSMDTRSATGLCEMLTGGPEEAEHVMDKSVSFTDNDLGFLEDDFEDLFQDLPDEGEYERFETLFSDSMNDRSMDYGFEDLLEDEKPAELDEAPYADLKEYDMNFDILTDHSVGYWEYTQHINAGDPLNGYITENHEMSDIENEDMLV